MSFKTYTHNPTPIDAIPVERPWKTVQFHVPSAHMVKTASGRFDYFRVANIGSLDVERAYEGDWIVRDPRTRKYSVMTGEEFQYHYGEQEPDVDGDPA